MANTILFNQDFWVRRMQLTIAPWLGNGHIEEYENYIRLRQESYTREDVAYHFRIRAIGILLSALTISLFFV